MNNARYRTLWVWAAVMAMVAPAMAQVDYTFEFAPNVASLSIPIDGADALTGLPGTSILLNPDLAANYPLNTNGYEPINNLNPCASTPINSPNVGISGFHAASGSPATAKLKLIDGLAGAQVDSVLTDFAWPAAVFQFDLAAATDIGEIRVFAANTDTDGRVFQNYDVWVSTDANPDTKERVFTSLIDSVITSIVTCGPDGYFPNGNDGCQVTPFGVPINDPQCDPGTKTNADRIGATLTRVYDQSNTVLAEDVTSIRFVFYAASNTARAFWDEHVGPSANDISPCSAPNPAEYYDIEDLDGHKRAFESSVIKEIDVIAAPRTTLVEDCDNTLDDDGDTLVDGDDPDCFGLTCPPEDCSNLVDDNGNSLVDCDDPDCLDNIACGAEICDNGIDDDGDSDIDCADSDCAADPACQCNDPFADVDDDGDVDGTDFAAVQRCLAGVGGGLGPDCSCFDRSSPGGPGVPDGDITADDLQAFFDCVSGPAILADAACDD